MIELEQGKSAYEKSKIEVRKITTVGLLAAVSLVLVMVVHIPFPPAPFLEYDPADIPILIGTLVYGPVTGLLLTFVVSAIQAASVSASSGIIGFLMHFVATGSMVVVTGLIYKHTRKSLPGVILALVLGSLAMIVAMVGMNLIFMPIFMGMERSVIVGMLGTVIIPFNAMKAVINAVAAFALTKTLEKAGVFHSLV